MLRHEKEVDHISTVAGAVVEISFRYKWIADRNIRICF